MIGAALLIEKVRYVAATDPDRVYNSRGRIGEGCTYRPNDRNDCGCIVGEALILAGVPVEKLEELDAVLLGGLGDKQSVATGWGDEDCRRVLAGFVTEGALSAPWVMCVQSGQDNGNSWANAVGFADNMVAGKGWDLR